MDDERMSVEENISNDENNSSPTENEQPAIDTEGEIIYDRNASLPDYKLFSLRNNSCLNFHQMINLDHSNQTKSPVKPNKKKKVIKNKKEDSFSSESKLSSDFEN